MFGTINLLSSSFMLSVTLAVNGMAEYTHDASCVFAGVFGGAIMQLWTVDARKPTKKIIIADLLSSGVSGFAVFAIAMLVKTPEELADPKFAFTFKFILLSAIIAGTTGSAGFRALIAKYKPEWTHAKSE